MYDDLVKKIRHCATDPMHCLSCGEDKDGRCFKRLMTQAADAIEQLSNAGSAYGRGWTLGYDAGRAESKPRWIPVTERLPEKMQYVLVRYQNNDMAVASWFGGDEHIRFWRAMTDEGWCADCDTEPTHWMPLPEPLKEET